MCCKFFVIKLLLQEFNYGKESYGAVALLEKQLDFARVDVELAEVETFITTITAHKATL